MQRFNMTLSLVMPLLVIPCLQRQFAAALASAVVMLWVETAWHHPAAATATPAY
jgi:hypothetical protein